MTSLDVCNLDIFLSTTNPPEGKRANEPIVERCVRLGLLEWFKYFCTVDKFPNGYQEHGGVYKERSDCLLCLAARYGHEDICLYIIDTWGLYGKKLMQAARVARDNFHTGLADTLMRLADTTETLD